MKERNERNEEGDLEDCDSDYRQHSDGNRDYAGSDQLHAISALVDS